MNLFLLEDGRLRSGWRFLISAFLAVALNYFAGFLAVGLADGHARIQEIIYRPLAMALELVVFFFLAKILDQPEQSLWTYIGLPRRGWLRDSLIGLLIGFLLVSIALMVIAFAHDLNLKFYLNARAMRVAAITIAVLLTGAMAEELVFRGYPFQRLVEGLGPTGAIVVLSALFGLVHMTNPHVSDNRWVQLFAFSNTLFIGIVLALAYLRTKALWLPFGMHFGWNVSLGLIYGLPVSGINQFSSIVRSKATGPEWLVGGAYGIEGGLLGTVVIILGLLYVVFFVKPAPELAPPPKMAESLPESIQPDSQV